MACPFTIIPLSIYLFLIYKKINSRLYVYLSTYLAVVFIFFPIANILKADFLTTYKMIFLENGDFVEIKNGQYKLFDSNLNEIEREIQEIDWEVSEAEKLGHDHFMYKEILEQAEVIERTISGRLELTSEEIPINLDEASKYEKIWIVACGTAYHAGLFGKDLFEKVLGVPVSVELASEFRYREPIVGANDLGIVISQSGETMDTIAATELLKENGAHVLALVNVVGSSLARMADSVFYLHVGPEIGVASTKAYLGMLVGQLLLAKHWDSANHEQNRFLS